MREYFHVIINKVSIIPKIPRLINLCYAACDGAVHYKGKVRHGLKKFAGRNYNFTNKRIQYWDKNGIPKNYLFEKFIWILKIMFDLK